MNINHIIKGFHRQKCSRLIVLLLLAAASTASAQNLNNPNKKGPLGTYVNTLSGNVFIKRTDIRVPARGFDIDISFYYNSFLYNDEIGFGKGWSFKYAIQYKKDTVPGARIIYWGDGREDLYDSLAPGVYKTPLGFFSKFSEYQPGKYKLAEPEGITYFFDNPVHRKVTRMEEPNGNYFNFIYTDSLLTSLVNNAGQSISFTYSPEGRVSTITDAIASPSVVYNYTYNAAGKLSEVTDPLGGKFKYTYLVNGPMSALTDKNNNKIDIIYFNDLSARELIGCNKRISFSYDTTANRTIVTDHFDDGGTNQVTTYNYKRLENLSWISALSGNCCGFNITFEYDDKGNQVKKIDANGHTYSYTYDERGNVLTASDASGNVSTYTYEPVFNRMTSYKDPKGLLYTMTYDARGNLTQLTAPGNNIYSATYNSNGDIISSTDPNGNTFTYNYNAYGKPATVTGPGGYNATLSYDARGNLLSHIDSRGSMISAEYDILNRIKVLNDPINNKVQFTYDANGNLVNYSNKNNEITTLKYDASNRIVKISAPAGAETEVSYDAMDNLKVYRNSLGNETSVRYDTRNRPVVITDAEGNSKTLSYDANGNITGVIQENGRKLNYAYDQSNRLISITDDAGPIATYAYDKNDNLTRITNGIGAVVTLAYDSLNQLKQMTDPLGNTIVYGYDKNGNITSVTDREGRTRSFTYDAFNRVKTFTDNNGFVITAGYDAEGNLTSLADQKNNITTYTYDSLNRRKTMTYPDGKFLQYSYDKKGNVLAKRLTDGTSILYAYDSLNRVTSRTMPGGEVISFTYDRIGRVLTATNNAGVVSFTYDKLNRVLTESFEGRVTQYTYDTKGRKQTITYPGNSVVVKEFDTRDRLTKIIKDGVVVAEYAYNNINNVTGTVFSNGISSTRQYDMNGRVSSISTGALQNSSFTYDKEGNKMKITRDNPSLSEEFSYDNGYRLTSYKRGPSGSPVTQNSYVYDAVGNRTSASINGVPTTYGVNNLNQLTGVNGTGFTFDNRGNLTYDGRYYKTYDAEGRLAKDSSSPANVITYLYDALGRRVSRSLNGTVSQYVYSNNEVIEQRDGANNITLQSVYSNFLSPVMNEKDGGKYYYHQNELFSVEAISDSAGRMIEKYSYDAYGKPSRFDSLGNPLLSSIAGNRLGFTGQEYDSATASYRFFFRNYSPETGVFNQRDLIEYEDGMGMYQYVGNNPANGIDVLGLCDEEEEGSWLSMVPIVGEDLDVYLNSDSPGERDVAALSLLETTGKAGVGNLISLSINGKPLVANLAKAGYHGAKIAVTKGGPIAMNAARTGASAIAAGGAQALTGAAVTGTAAVAAPVLVVGLYGNEVYKERMEVDDRISNTEAYIHMLENGKEGEGYERYLKLKGLDDAIEKRNRFNKLLEDDCPEGGTKKRYRLMWDKERMMWVLVPIDPNLIIGPDGVAEKKWVSVNDRMPYTVLFENDSSATARARYIKIVTPVEPKQDAATLELGSVGFNNQSFDIPPGNASYYQRLDARDSTGVYVDLTAGYNVLKNEIFWEFQAIDPITLMPPEDPLAGFLFLRDSIQKAYGNGFVNFSIKPLSSSITLDTIGAQAFIVFDGNEVIPTNVHTNTIDAFPPVSQLTSATATGNQVTLQWTGADDTNGSGVSHYSVYVATDQLNYTLLFDKVYGTDTTFSLPGGTNYCFFVLGTDSVGNKEKLRQGMIQCTSTTVVLPVTWLSFTGTNQAKNNLLEWATATEQNSREFRLERSLNGTTWTDIATLPAAGNSTSIRRYRHTDANIHLLNSEVMFYRVRQIDLDGRSVYTNVVRLSYRESGITPSILYPNPTSGSINVLIGDKKLIGTEAMVMDMNGRVLMRVELKTTNQHFDLSKFVNGVYLIRLSNKETLRVVKQ